MITITSLCSNAADIDPAGTNIQEQIRQQERQKQLRQQQELTPDERNNESTKNAKPTVSDIIPEHETPCFSIAHIELVGESAEKFQFAINEALTPRQGEQAILGRCLGVLGINAILTRAQNAIIARGYVTTRVLAAPQDLKSGTLQLTLIPGRVNAIRFTPDSSQRANAWNAIPINKGDLLNLRDIEQALENFKRVPSAEADIQIEPATATADQADANQPGLSDIVIRYQQRFPIRVSLSLDDAGADTTGKYQGGVTISGDHLLSLNDLFYINYNHDLGGGDQGRRGNDGYSVHYSIPWDYWLLSFNSSTNDYHQTVSGINQNFIFSGTSQNNEVKLNRLVYRNSVNKTNVSLKGFLRKSNNYIDDIEIEVQRRRTAGFELGVNQSWYIGAAVLDYNLAYRRGTGAQNSLKAPEEPLNQGTSRMALLLADINFNLPFHISAPWGQQALQYSANLRGQTHYTPLTPQDRFNIGNRYTVRGFDGQQTLIADSGWFIRNELSMPLARSGQSLYWGLDYGEVGGPSSDFLLGQYLAGTVIGLRGGLGNRFGSLNYDLFVSKPLNKPNGFDTPQSTAGFNVNYAY